jgi:RNA polymerase sigma-70 factor (ECF subfamily)
MNYCSCEDGQLVEIFCAGDIAVFEILIERYNSPVYGYLLHMILDENTASDLFQETFTTTFWCMESYRGKRSFRKCLFTVAHNVTFNYLRMRGQDPDCSQDNPPLERKLRGIAYCHRSGKKTGHDIIRRAMCSLPEKSRELLLLKECSGLSFAEIASITGLPVQSVLDLMHQALSELNADMPV